MNRMRSRHHFPISVGVGVALAATIETPLPWPALVVGAGLLGTFVDLDHFVIARARTGSWEHLRRCLADPRLAFLRQTEIFEEGDIGALTRLSTHAVIAAALAVALWPVAPPLSIASTAVIGVHVLCDVAWELFHRR